MTTQISTPQTGGTRNMWCAVAKLKDETHRSAAFCTHQAVMKGQKLQARSKDVLGFILSLGEIMFKMY
jgi:hypothetical protein